MAIKTVKFTGLSSTSFMYTAIGGIRFYDENNTVIPSGAIISNSEISAETDNFLLTATSGPGHAYYYVGNAFNTNALQTGDGTDYSYWMSSNDNQTLTCEFKTPVSKINKIEFVPLPDAYTTIRGVDEQFNIELWDEFDVLSNTYTIIPITTNNIVQSLNFSDGIITSTGVITTNLSLIHI